MKGDIPESALRAAKEAKSVQTHTQPEKTWTHKAPRDPFGCRRIIPVERVRKRV
jgi:hypothetical protein